jgi:hypothetical protein
VELKGTKVIFEVSPECPVIEYSIEFSFGIEAMTIKAASSILSKRLTKPMRKVSDSVVD